MNLIIEVIASFIAGIVTMPFLSEGYSFLRRRELQKNYSNQKKLTNYEHKERMQRLTKEFNGIVEKYNKKLSTMKKRLRHHDIFLESDDNDNLIVVKRVLVKTSFMDWLKQKRW